MPSFLPSYFAWRPCTACPRRPRSPSHPGPCSSRRRSRPRTGRRWPEMVWKVVTVRSPCSTSATSGSVRRSGRSARSPGCRRRCRPRAHRRARGRRPPAARRSGCLYVLRRAGGLVVGLPAVVPALDPAPLLGPQKFVAPASAFTLDCRLGKDRSHLVVECCQRIAFADELLDLMARRVQSKLGWTAIEPVTPWQRRQHQHEQSHPTAPSPSPAACPYRSAFSISRTARRVPSGSTASSRPISA